MVTNVNNTQYAFINNENQKAEANEEIVDVNLENKTDNTEKQAKPEFDEKVMMDLSDVQNFLFMMIGSEIRIKSDDTYSANINFVA